MAVLMPMPHPYCLADHKVLSTLEKPRESASAPTLEAVMPETSHRSSVSSRIQLLCSRLVKYNNCESCGNILKTLTYLFFKKKKKWYYCHLSFLSSNDPDYMGIYVMKSHTVIILFYKLGTKIIIL